MMSRYPSDERHTDEATSRIAVTEVPRRAGSVLVAVTGDLDIGTTDTFDRRLSEILAGRSDHLLELDLSALEFCDLIGLRALCAWGQARAENRQRIRITAAGPALDLLLHFCRIPALLDHVPQLTHREND